MNLKWKSEYNIGNYQIDKEHQKLFEIAQKAIKANTSHDKSDELKNIIKELFAYTSKHFINEEKLMLSLNYPDYTSHKEKHATMLSSLNDIILKFNSLELEKIQKTLGDFIYEYFVRHIITEDKRIELFQIPIDDLKKNFGWKDIYKIGNDTIDNEHKKLFDIASEAFEHVEPSQRNEKIKDVLSRLYNYMKTHFSHEEQYMEKIKYEFINTQKKQHTEIINNMNDFIKKLPTMNIELFEKELATLIEVWILQHIIQEDRKMLDWVNSKQLKD